MQYHGKTNQQSLYIKKNMKARKVKQVLLGVGISKGESKDRS
jgi:hypothetical protein